MNAIRRCDDADLAAIEAIINDAARAYRGVIPEDRRPVDNGRRNHS